MQAAKQEEPKESEWNDLDGTEIEAGEVAFEVSRPPRNGNLFGILAPKVLVASEKVFCSFWSRLLEKIKCLVFDRAGHISSLIQHDPFGIIFLLHPQNHGR